jgi:capsid portal protein
VLTDNLMVDDEEEAKLDSVELHQMMIGFELAALHDLEAKKVEHDAEKRSRKYWAKEVLIETNRVPDANPASFAAFATAVARDCSDFLGSFAKNNLVPVTVLNQVSSRYLRIEFSLVSHVQLVVA